MEQIQRNTTARVRSPIIRNLPFVQIGVEDITDTLKIDSPAHDLVSALAEVKRLWESGEADYVAPTIIEGQKGYYIYTPEKGRGESDPTVPEYIGGMKGYGGIYIDIVRCRPEDSNYIRIAMLVIKDT